MMPALWKDSLSIQHDMLVENPQEHNARIEDVARESQAPVDATFGERDEEQAADAKDDAARDDYSWAAKSKSVCSNRKRAAESARRTGEGAEG